MSCTFAAHAFASTCFNLDDSVLQDPEIEGDVAAVVGAPLALDMVRVRALDGGPLQIMSLREVPTGTVSWSGWAELPEEAWVRREP